MPSVWDDASEKILLLSIIEITEDSKLEWKAVATSMRNKGFTFTNEACRQHYQKIRREFKSATASAQVTAPTTPAGTNIVKSGGSRAGRRHRQKGSKSLTGVAGDDDEEMTPVPTGKRRKLAMSKEEVLADNSTNMNDQSIATTKAEGDAVEQFSFEDDNLIAMEHNDHQYEIDEV